MFPAAAADMVGKFNAYHSFLCITILYSHSYDIDISKPNNCSMHYGGISDAQY